MKSLQAIVTATIICLLPFGVLARPSSYPPPQAETEEGISAEEISAAEKELEKSLDAALVGAPEVLKDSIKTKLMKTEPITVVIDVDKFSKDTHFLQWLFGRGVLTPIAVVFIPLLLFFILARTYKGWDRSKPKRIIAGAVNGTTAIILAFAIRILFIPVEFTHFTDEKYLEYWEPLIYEAEWFVVIGTIIVLLAIFWFVHRKALKKKEE